VTKKKPSRNDPAPNLSAYSAPDSERRSVFAYQCQNCGHVASLALSDSASCINCGHTFPIIDGRVIVLYDGKTNQNDYFDKIYAPETDQAAYFEKIYGVNPSSAAGLKRESVLYDGLAAAARSFVELSGLNFDADLKNLDILEVACGSGWVTGTLLRAPSVQNCRFHAFDISPDGPRMLGRFAAPIESSNVLELSVQDACSMLFAPNSFDLILGNSILHHFDDFEFHLDQCYNALRPGGVALFGEPFALGHMLAASCLMIATLNLGRKVPAITAYYSNTSYKLQNYGNQDALRHKVDKHMYMREIFFQLSRRIGFSHVEIRPRHTFDFFSKGYFIDRALAKLGVKDEEVQVEARKVYKVFADMFSANTFAYVLPQFMDIIMRK